MKVFKKIGLLIPFFFTSSLFACDLRQGDAFEPIPVDGRAIVFDLVPIEKELGDASQTQEIGIDINFFKCSDGSRNLIGQLPYLADTGKVRSAFLYNFDGGDVTNLFVVHSVEIRSDTGIRYSGDYYSVNVYKVNGENFVRDDRLSAYFGSGGDILAENNKDLLYVFPYKSEALILAKISSSSFAKWSKGGLVNLIVSKITPMHRAPVLADVTRMYLVAGDKVSQDAVEAGWLSIIYKTSKGKIIRGWILCDNADGC